jgi:hypothetical protein
MTDEMILRFSKLVLGCRYRGAAVGSVAVYTILAYDDSGTVGSRDYFRDWELSMDPVKGGRMVCAD